VSHNWYALPDIRNNYFCCTYCNWIDLPASTEFPKCEFCRSPTRYAVPFVPSPQHFQCPKCYWVGIPVDNTVCKVCFVALFRFTEPPSDFKDNIREHYHLESDQSDYCSLDYSPNTSSASNTDSDSVSVDNNIGYNIDLTNSKKQRKCNEKNEPDMDSVNK
jgi:hypothetical protein